MRNKIGYMVYVFPKIPSDNDSNLLLSLIYIFDGVRIKLAVNRGRKVKCVFEDLVKSLKL